MKYLFIGIAIIGLAMTSPAEAVRKSDYDFSCAGIKIRAEAIMKDGHWKWIRHAFQMNGATGSREQNQLFKMATAQIAIAGHMASYYGVFCKQSEG